MPLEDKEFKNQLKEEFELDVEKNRYEKINVPAKGTNRFVHDFYSVSPILYRVELEDKE
jgi:hypothetical protein